VHCIQVPCPAPNDLDILDEAWPDFAAMIEDVGIELETIEDAKAFMTDKCATVPHHEGEMCVSKAMVPVMEAMIDPACEMVMSDEEVCRIDHFMVNDTCAIKLGVALVQTTEAIMKDLWMTGTEFHCHSFNCEMACYIDGDVEEFISKAGEP
jgi:hypothetical protein